MKERVEPGILLKPWESSMFALLLCSIILVAHAGVSAQQQAGIRVEVDLVNLYVSVTNTRGVPIEGLAAPDFQVYEDDVEQQVRHFSTDDAPYTIGLVLDRSGSMAGMIDEVFQAAVHTVEESKPGDEAFVIVFNHQVELVQDFTTNRGELSGDSGEDERSFRREDERHSRAKTNSHRSVATLASRFCRKCSRSSRETIRSAA
jgi:VWFA-related protein